MACRKVSYGTLASAEKALERINSLPKNKRFGVSILTHAYKCPHCPYYHLSSNGQK